MAWLEQCDVCGGSGFFCSHHSSNPDLNHPAIAGAHRDAGPAIVQEFQFFGRHGDGNAWLAEDAKGEEVVSEPWADPPMAVEKLNMWDDENRRGSCSYRWPAVDSCLMSACSGTTPSTDAAAVGLTTCVGTTEPFYGCIDCSSADATEMDKAPPTSKDEAGNMDREARVRRYREKKKRRKFGKQVRYESRKAYAESRPRVRGRFVKTSEGASRPPSPPLPPPQRDADQFGVGWYRAFGP